MPGGSEFLGRLADSQRLCFPSHVFTKTSLGKSQEDKLYQLSDYFLQWKLIDRNQVLTHIIGKEEFSDEDLLIFLGGLLSGLFIVTPILNFYLNIPPAATVGVVGTVYGVIALRRRVLLPAGVIATIVTSTFAGQIPLASQEILASMPGDIGPEIFFVYPAILGSVSLVLIVDRRGFRQSWTTAGTLFLAFVFWVTIGSVAAAPPRPDIVVYYAVYLLMGLLAFQLLKYIVERGVIGFQAVVATLFITIVGHLCYGALQFFNQATFGVSQLGEPLTSRALAEVQLGIFGTWNLGTFVTGFAGFTFHIAALGVLVAGLPFAYYVSHDELGRYTLPVTILAAGIVRATTSDAARGAFLITLVLTPVALFLLPRLDQLRLPTTPNVKLRPLVIGFVALLVTLVPSSKSGSAAQTSSPDSETVSSGVSSPGSGSTSGTVGADSAESLLSSTTVPFFDLSNLSIRVQQYILGLDLFAANPLIGIGAGNFMFYGGSVDSALFLEMHNLYLAVLVETGVVGFLLYFGAIALVARRGIRVLLQDTISGEKAVLIAIFAGLIGQFAIGVFDSTQLIKVTVFVPFWILLGTIAGLSASKERT